MISGDPKVKELRYHLHQRKFIVAEGDQPDLSVVHVRCNLRPVKNGYRTPTKGGKPKDGAEGYVYQDAEVPDLIDTDFERTLNVVFQIIQWDHNQTAANNNNDSINLDFWLDKLPDKIAEDDKGYQYELDTEEGAILLHDAIKLKFAEGEMSDEQRAWVDNQVWTGEVGRMAFTKSRESAREFTWTLHHVDGVLNSRKVSGECLCAIRLKLRSAVSISITIFIPSSYMFMWMREGQNCLWTRLLQVDHLGLSLKYRVISTGQVSSVTHQRSRDQNQRPRNKSTRTSTCETLASSIDDQGEERMWSYDHAQQCENVFVFPVVNKSSIENSCP